MTNKLRATAMLRYY